METFEIVSLPNKILNQKEIDVLKNKTNEELRKEDIFKKWIWLEKGIRETRRQASKYRNEFFTYLEKHH